jgi:hypothetical protein
MNVDAAAFARGLEAGERHPEIAGVLWELLRDQAFVADFRPDAFDDLAKVYAMGAEEVRDELIDVLLTKLRLDVASIDFSGFDFASLTTPKDVSRFVSRVADAQGAEGKRRMSEMMK